MPRTALRPPRPPRPPRNVEWQVALKRARCPESCLVSRAIAAMRVFFGLVYFTNGLAKFVPGLAHVPGGYFLIDSNGARTIVEHNARDHPVQAYHDLVFNVFVPNWSLFGSLLGLAEVTAGLLLILGLASSCGALLA